MENLVVLIGNIGADPELKEAGAHKVVSLQMATTEKIQGTEKTQWHKLVFWNKGAELVTEYLKKGDKIYIRGKLQYRHYDKDQIRHYVTEIIVDKFRKL